MKSLMKTLIIGAGFLVLVALFLAFILIILQGFAGSFGPVIAYILRGIGILIACFFSGVVVQALEDDTL